MVMEDYLDDLAGHDPMAVERACIEYRKNPENKFFPKSGEILGILNAGAKYETRSYLPTFRAPIAIEGPRGKTKTVAEVLRDNGYKQAAERWSQ